MDVLRKINKMRLDRNWSIYRLSVESEVSQSTLTNMFNRETLPSITTLESICKAFGVTMSDFFAEEDSPSEELCDGELLSMYHSLTPKAKQTISNLLRELKQ